MTLKKAALITGGAKRIGGAISLFLAEKGFDIALHYNNSHQEALEVKEQINKLGKECTLFKCDLNDAAKVQTLIKDVQTTFPQLCLLVNNASIFEEGLFLDTEATSLEKHFNINFKVPYLLSHDFVKLCKKGQIINMLDTNITRKHSKYFAYNLSKKTLYEFTKMAAHELGPDIRVNAVAPGPILPPIGKNGDYLNNKTTKIPLNYTGELKHVLQAVNYFLENNFTTGECLFVDGGKHLIN